MPGTAGTLNAVVAPDDYTVGSTLDGGAFLDHLNIDVVNQAIYWQIRQITRAGDPPTLASWQPEVYMLPGSRAIERPGMTGVRFRAAIPAAQLAPGTRQAVVTAETVAA